MTKSEFWFSMIPPSKGTNNVPSYVPLKYTVQQIIVYIYTYSVFAQSWELYLYRIRCYIDGLRKIVDVASHALYTSTQRKQKWIIHRNLEV
jgi:hypothetical protein